MPTPALEFTVETAPLRHALAAVLPAVPRKSEPVLQHVLLTIDPDNGAELCATDKVLGIRHAVTGLTTSDGFLPGARHEILLPPERMKQILDTVPDESLKCRVGAEGLEVRGQRSRYKLTLDPPEAFPAWPRFEAAAYHAIRGTDLRRLIRRTLYACDPESSRYALGGCLLEFGDGTLTFVATDGRQLAHQTVPCTVVESGTDTTGKPIVPLKTLKNSDRIFGESDAEIRISIDPKNSVMITDGTATVWSRLLEGRFPAVEGIFPKECKARAGVAVGVLHDALAHALITTDIESRGCDCRFAEGKLTLATETSDIGAARVQVELTYDHAEPLEITIDPRDLINALRTLELDTKITIELVDAKTAVVVRTEDNFRYVVMPLTKEG